MTHFVYVVASNCSGILKGPVKVGITKNPKSRLLQLQTGNHLPLTMMTVFSLPSKDMAYEVEQVFHATHSEYRLSGEWFDMNPYMAVASMCMNIEIAVHYTGGLNEEGLELSIDCTGVNDAMDMLREVYLERLSVQ